MLLLVNPDHSASFHLKHMIIYIIAVRVYDIAMLLRILQTDIDIPQNKYSLKLPLQSSLEVCSVNF